MILQVVLENCLSNSLIELGHLDLEVLVEIFIPKDDIVGVLSFVISDFLEIGVHFLGAPIIIEGWLRRPQLILIVWVHVVRVVSAWTWTQMLCPIVVIILLIGGAPKNCP
jgi:hypothetical protein